MLASTGVYLGLATFVLGLLALVRPVHALGIGDRGRALAVAAVGLAIAAASTRLPTRARRVDPRDPSATRLDRLVPVFEFDERHETRIAADPRAVDRAIRLVTADEILLFRTLTWIRRFGRSGPPSILNPPPDVPLMDVATRTGFTVLADEPGHEIVFGFARHLGRPSSDGDGGGGGAPGDAGAAFAALDAPGVLKVAMNFHLSPDDRGGTRLTTETRVHATDAASRRTFATYWRVIRPGSALIRRAWLRAIRLRAEAEASRPLVAPRTTP